ncbi:MAG: ATP-binding protein [Pseudomonadota bacterium]|nr:ATP-binding protein [Pseudomonadota bacterium]
MTSARLRWYHRFSIHSAYGQLIALVFFPISALALIGAWLVLEETHQAAMTEQRNAAQAILARYVPAGQALAPLLDQPEGVETTKSILRSMFEESGLLRIALVDVDGRQRMSMGYGAMRDWPAFEPNREMFGPLPSPIGTTYGQRIGFTSDGPVWLLIDMDNQPFQLARHRVWLALAITCLVTLLLLLLCLNIYSRRWIAPIYEMRLQLQRLNADTLHHSLEVSSSGELRLLQKDVSYLLRRLHSSFEELKAHTEQTEDDLRRTLDELEIQNITYRKARDLAIQSNNAKSAFLANISHELRTPLNSIDGFINLLSRRGQLSSEQNLYVQTIRKSSAHLLALINDVLDFSKIEAGKLALENAPFNLEEAVFDVLDMLSPLASDKKLNLAVYYYDDVPRQVRGDILRFKQILTNLVSNAIKFTPDGEVVVRVQLDSSHAQTHQLHVSVQDSGIGLSVSDRDKLFQSFSQADPSVTRQFGGTGLGLAISRQLCRLMNGEIGFEDNLTRDGQGKGSTFWFQVQFGRIHEVEMIWPNLSDRRVLASMQHTASRHVLRGYLARMNIELEEASSLADLFGRLYDFEQQCQGQGWVIVDHDSDMAALLREIRTRYSGAVMVYGYQMMLDPDELEQYHAQALYQPLSRQNLQAILQHSPISPPESYDFSDQHLHVLAVDDHLPNLMVLDALLSDLGVYVTTVSSGQDAIQQIKQRAERNADPFDLIFMDIQMPRMSGLEATQQIRDIEASWTPPMHVPIIALTAHALADERDQLRAAGMDDYVGKPIHHEQLVHLIQTWTMQRQSNYQPDQPRDALPTLSDLGNVPQDQQPMIDWAACLKHAAQKPDLAFDLLSMLLDGLTDDQQELEEALAQADDARLEQRAHRLHGATRYTGVPALQQQIAELEQYLIQSRKQGRAQTPEHRQHLTELTHAVLQVIQQLLSIDLAYADLDQLTTASIRPSPPQD